MVFGDGERGGGCEGGWREGSGVGWTGGQGGGCEGLFVEVGFGVGEGGGSGERGFGGLMKTCGLPFWAGKDEVIRESEMDTGVEIWS